MLTSKEKVRSQMFQNTALGVTMRKRKARHHNRCQDVTSLSKILYTAYGGPDREALTVWNSTRNMAGRKKHSSRNYLCHWRTTLVVYRDPNSDFRNSPALATSIKRAIRSQNVIGWFSFLNRFLSTEWIDTQDRYYKSISTRRRAGRPWVIDFIQTMVCLICPLDAPQRPLKQPSQDRRIT